MAEFVPIDPTGKSTDDLVVEIALTLNRTHDCIHRGQAEQARRDQEAADKRHQMANTIFSIQGSVRSLFKRVGGIETTQKIDHGRVDKLAKMFGAEGVPRGQKPPKPRGLMGWSGWKIGLAACGAAGGVVTIYKIAEPVSLAFLHWVQPALQVIDNAIKAAG